MDISSINTQFLNNAYVPLSYNSPASTVPGSGEGFAEILKRTQASQSRLPDSGDAQILPKRALGKTPIDKTDKLYEMCLELETFLIKNLVKSMRSTVQKSELIKTGFAGGVYEDMLYDEYAREYAKNADFGFAEMAYRELSGNSGY